MAQTTFELMDRLNFAEAVETIKQIVYKGNGLLAANNFWTLVKGDEAQLRQLQDLIYLAFEITRVSSLLLLPICPDLAR
jgi:methionyl-tRNA synthetase